MRSQRRGTGNRSAPFPFRLPLGFAALYQPGRKRYSTMRMTHLKGIFRKHGPLAPVPLYVAYAALPMASLARRVPDVPLTPPAAAPWAVLAALGFLAACAGRENRAPSLPKALGAFALVGLIASAILMYVPDALLSLPVLAGIFRESAPLAYLLFCALWTATFGLPSGRDFIRLGAALGALVVADTAAEFAFAGAAPALRWIGNADMLAVPLLASMCACLGPGDSRSRADTLCRALILFGLAATLSRAALFASIWIVLWLNTASRGRRLVVSGFFALVLAGSFLVAPAPGDAVRYADYWLWVEGFRLFSENPSLLAAGFPVHAPLPMTFSPGMAMIWHQAQGVSPDIGVFLPQIGPFWLRASLAWGALVPVACMTALAVPLSRRPSRMGAGLAACLFAMGMVSPLLYSPATGMVIGLALLTAFSPAMRDDFSTPVSEPVPDSDPEDWDMRPL